MLRGIFFPQPSQRGTPVTLQTIEKTESRKSKAQRRPPTTLQSVAFMNKGRDRGNLYSFLTLTGPAEAAEVNARVQVLEEEERNTVLAAPQEAALHRIIYQK